MRTYISSDINYKLLLCYICSVKSKQRLQAATVLERLKIRDPLTKYRHHLYQSMYRRHIFLHMKFEMCFIIPFTKKSMSNQKVALFLGNSSIHCSKGGVWKSVTFLDFSFAWIFGSTFGRAFHMELINQVVLKGSWAQSSHSPMACWSPEK
jgi:hypothetical protein